MPMVPDRTRDTVPTAPGIQTQTPLITLTSDFNTPYPAAMKGVLATRTDARLIDVAHDFPPQDVRTAAFWLREILPYFPPAVHLAVVDPGVGTDRRALVLRAGDHALIGPDNGLLLPAGRRLAADQALEAFAIDPEAISTPVPQGVRAMAGSHTFDGRDLFAPAAALVAHPDSDIDSLVADGTLEAVPLEDLVDCSFPEPRVDDGERATGSVLVIDGFGNVITNIPGRLLDDQYGASARVNGESAPVARSYAHVAESSRLLTVGSHGFVELAVNGGRGDVAFDVTVGDAVTLTLE